jgi:hypothetical protein
VQQAAGGGDVAGQSGEQTKAGGAPGKDIAQSNTSTQTSAGGPLAHPSSSVAAAAGAATAAGGKASAMPDSPLLPNGKSWLPAWLCNPNFPGQGPGQFPGQFPGPVPPSPPPPYGAPTG